MRRLPSSIALLLVSVAAARVFAAVGAPMDCWSLRKHGHRAEAQACFDGLTRSGDAYARAEGFWGLE